MTREEALEKVRQMNLQKETREILEALAPELRESEDERARKSLIKFLTDIKRISESGRTTWAVRKEDVEMCKSSIAYLEKQKEQKPAECRKDALIEWAKFVLKCQEEELAKYDGPSYMKASTMGRIDAYKVLIAKLNSL